jgi:hypothetical protein
MAKYCSLEHRNKKPNDLLENRDFVTIEYSPEDLKILVDMNYKYINKLDKYKDGTKV